MKNNTYIPSLHLPAFRVLCLLLIFLGFGISAIAQVETTHTVKAGETLFSISKQYDVSVDKLREWNNLSSDQLRVGQRLVVDRQEQSQENRIIHKVQPRETLFSISKQYGVSITEIKQWNSLQENALAVGQELTIYRPDRQQQNLPDSAGTSLVVNTPTRSNTYYTVKSGDTLYEIARDHNMTLSELKSLNDLTSNTIRIGQRLTVRKVSQAAPSVAESAEESTPQGAFVVHRVAQGTTLRDLLRRYNMTEAEFRALNPDISTSLRSGQRVTVLLPPSRNYQNPYLVQSNMKSLGQTPVTRYGPDESGTTTTSGELYNPGSLTAAHANIALGNVIFIRNPTNQKGIFVRINDRFTGEGLKLSQAALRALDLDPSASASVNMYQDQ
ncbi:MAG: LysM peptidoglycan-binding domain-containing protein [Balneolaceae bacterium]|nr:LysM peptidoglycan-binding domain-containing protein [Balneolaceae bacterium]